jgi:hypothetical protein
MNKVEYINEDAITIDIAAKAGELIHKSNYDIEFLNEVIKEPGKYALNEIYPPTKEAPASYRTYTFSGENGNVVEQSLDGMLALYTVSPTDQKISLGRYLMFVPTPEIMNIIIKQKEQEINILIESIQKYIDHEIESKNASKDEVLENLYIYQMELLGFQHKMICIYDTPSGVQFKCSNHVYEAFKLEFKDKTMKEIKESGIDWSFMRAPENGDDYFLYMKGADQKVKKLTKLYRLIIKMIEENVLDRELIKPSDWSYES